MPQEFSKEYKYEIKMVCSNCGKEESQTVAVKTYRTMIGMLRFVADTKTVGDFNKISESLEMGRFCDCEDKAELKVTAKLEKETQKA